MVRWYAQSMKEVSVRLYEINIRQLIHRGQLQCVENYQISNVLCSSSEKCPVSLPSVCSCHYH